MTYEDSRNAISSRGSGDGVTPCGSPDGMTLDMFGQAARPASPSAQQDSAKVRPTNGTSGPSTSALSPSIALQQSLASRLEQRLATAGSMLFSLTWKAKDTPARRPYCQLVASARRISDSDCGSWPTPGTPNGGRVQSVETTITQHKPDGTKAQAALENVAQLAAWPTARGTDGDKNTRTAAGSAREMKRKGGPQDLIQAATLAGWATPKVATGKYCYSSGDHSKVVLNLEDQADIAHVAQYASWVSPQASDGHGSGLKQNTASLDKQARGQTPNGSHASTEKRGQLNPALARWLMGYPPEWCGCAVMATPSSRRSRRK